MKEFMKKVPQQVASTFTIMMIVFSVIAKLKGIEFIPVMRLGELFFLAMIGGILMEFVFGKYVFKQMEDMKRVCIFIVPFAIITFLAAVIFEWFTELDSIVAYLKFFGIFLVCGAISVLLFEMEHRSRGREYTRKLKEYQNGNNENTR